MAPASKQQTTSSIKKYTPTPTLGTRVADIVKKIQGLKVETPEQSIAASKVLREAAILRREIKADYEAQRKPYVQKQRDLIAEEKALTEKLAQVEQHIQRLIKALADKIAAEQQAKVEAERAQREAEAKAEAQLRADQIRAAAEAAPSKSVKNRLLAQADVVANATPIIDPVEIEDAPQLLAEGLHERKGSVHGAVDSLEALVLQVAAGIMLKRYGGSADAIIRTYLETFKPSAQATINVLLPSMVEINRLCVAFPSDLDLAGVRVVEDEGSLVARK